ncbi:hypothetical protein AKJ52_02055 [candidate division MSBL1 archaeon SCGC-AAA382C18]|uniref:Iron ABC transporter n=1 Tax=candidate division MSBL1 archaeon SCGC-AAA382C18 TaxID=1698281 RepID=A0A133VJH4_9EURY|nr:hypothetical protein AKJ52_02055 [candidate division MSBL1 archaeon SCGC-AAA382C18]
MEIVRQKLVNWRWIVLGLIAGLVATIIISSTLGAVDISPLTVVKIVLNRVPLIDGLISQSFPARAVNIVISIRLPRIITGVLVGAALGVAGTTVQGIFRNPMAEPYTVGISAGAALGAVTVIFYDLGFFGAYTIPFVSFFFAVGTILLVYNIAKVDGEVPVGILLLSGIAVSLFLQALVSIFMYTAGEELHQMVFWLMGGLWNRNWIHVQMILPPILLGSVVIYTFSRGLDAMLLGEESAQHLGIRVERLKKILLIIAAMVTASAVAVSGIIGFVGLIIPHIMRILVGSDHRILFPTAALGGGIFLAWADTLARTIPVAGQLPVGIITSLAGAPFFVYLLRRKKYSY